jgi:hypothetical protein
MRGCSLKSWYSLGSLAVLGACSNIIGVSDIRIDPSLDQIGEGGNSSSGGKTSGGSSVQPDAGEDSGGEATAGKASGGTNTGGTDAVAGEAGTGGEPVGPGGCHGADDCDDEIDCTKDTCTTGGKCVHTADDAACTPASGMCSTCQVGIGCVDSAPTVKELLLDGTFDDQTGDWSEYSETFDKNVFADAAAQSGGYAVHFGPAAPAAKEREFADLTQQFTVPAKTIKLTASGYYKLLPGANVAMRPIAGDYTSLTLFSLAQPADDMHKDTWFIRYVDYHSFEGGDAQQAAWTAFSYETPKGVLAKVAGQEVTLDLVCETWDTLYYFDSLSLKATVCE